MLKTLSKIDFEQFLKTLDADRGKAAEKYIALRERLERFFEWRDCENPLELTDIVFDRITKKVIEGEKIENTEAFCVSIAKFVLMENRREVLRNSELNENSREISFETEQNVADDKNELQSERLKCLDECLSKIPFEKQKLLINYFDTDEKTLISSRKNLAENLGINLNSLRIRISRLKSKLEKCTKKCCDKT